jgi:hypothetical protein
MAENERGPQHEESDVDVWAVGRFVAAMVVVIAISLGLLFGLFRYFEAATGGEKPVASERVNPGKRPPEPRLEVTPVEDLRKFREAEDRALNAYGWMDREHGVVRIPIARAMELLAQRGLPARREAGPLSEAAGVSVPTESGLGETK